MSRPTSPSEKPVASAWWLVLGLIGLDYFSTLAYLPSLAVQGVGPLAPLAALVVAAVTLLGALPLYLYLVGRSPHGRGASGLLEHLVPGWRGKLLVLLLLAFVATDYVVTQNLSVADAAEHVRANPLFRAHVDSWLDAHWHPETWWTHPWWQWLVGQCDRHLAVTLLFSILTLGLWEVWRRGATRWFLRVAALVVAVYLALTLVVLVSGVAFLAGEGRGLVDDWWHTALVDLRQEAGVRGPLSIARFLQMALVSFPYVALGLSGFELCMAVVPLVRGDDTDDPREPRVRIRNMRKLLVMAACMMSVLAPTAVTITTILTPMSAFQEGGPAVHRALAYLAHGGGLADGSAGESINPLFGPVFGTLYDLSTISILCLAGACVAIALRDFVPESLQRFGMELDWARRLGVKMRFFNFVVLVVVILFRAHVAALQWVYATSVLVLLSGGALAGWLALRQQASPSASDTRWARRLMVYPAAAALLFFLSMTLVTLVISRAGLEIALGLGAGMFCTSIVSRWIRSTEIRFSGFEFVDDPSRRLWEECCQMEFQVLVPHRPGWHSRAEKEEAIRERHRLPAQTPIILVEAHLGDTSDFVQHPLMRVTRENGATLIQVSRCVSVAHVLASIGLAMGRVGRPPELHFGWSNESPLAANLSFLLFGEGNIPWMVRELIRRAEPDSNRRPRVIIG
ncbi:MAG: amino acid transporter [Planctomycetales bacterium]